jgi:hypothetical protein
LVRAGLWRPVATATYALYSGRIFGVPWGAGRGQTNRLATFIVFVAAFVFIERSFSPTFQQCVASPEGNNPSLFGVTIDQYVRCTGGFVKTYEAAISALAAVIIAAFTGTLWVATSRQAALTREAFIADKRAFVFASGIQSFYEPDPSGHFNWRIAPVWQNSGDTPTRRLRIYTDGFFSNAPISPTFDFNYIDPKSPAGTGLLGPKMPCIGGQAPHSPHQAALTPQDILDIQNGKKFFYLWDWVRYYDTLPNTSEHITRFCWRILSTGNPLTFNPLVDPNSVRFFNLYDARGNCADEECVLQGLG